MRILLVDDDADLRGALAKSFRHWGHTVHEAVSVHEAISAMMQASIQGFDAVITDHDMPGGSGSVLARQLWAIGFRGLIVCHTGGGLISVIDKTLFNHLLQKPVPLKTWRSLLG